MEKEPKKISKTEAIKYVEESYNSILEDLENAEPITNLEIEDIILEGFKECFPRELDYQLEYVYSEIEEKDYIDLEELEDMLDNAINIAEKACNEYIDEGIVEYIYEHYPPEKAKELEEQLEQYVEYLYKHNL